MDSSFRSSGDEQVHGDDDLPADLQLLRDPHLLRADRGCLGAAKRISGPDRPGGCRSAGRSMKSEAENDERTENLKTSEKHLNMFFWPV